jgi:hypothetical protein
VLKLPLSFMLRTLKCFFCIAILYLISFSSYSQKFSFGIKGGGLINWAAFGDKAQKDTFSTKPIPGYNTGFQISFPLKKNFEFLVEGGYAQKGRRLRFNEGSWENKSVFKFIEATMLLRKNYKFFIRKNVPSQWFFNIGPEINYLLEGKGSIIIDNNKPGYAYSILFNQTPDGNYKNMYYNNFNKWLFGLAVGIGFKVPMRRNQHLTTELRFVSGHTFLGKRNSSYIEILGFEDTLLTNLKSLNLSLAYTFDFDIQKSRKGKSTLEKSIKKTR